MTYMITIIIPIFNKEKYISRCLDSVINQTFKNIEILVINDGSTDNSLNIINRYKKKDNRFKVINQKNQGPSKARNVGIENASAEVLFFMDADDTIEEEALEDMYFKMIEDNSDIVHSKIRYISKVFEVKEDKNLFVENSIFKEILSLNTSSSISANLYKKKLFIENNISFPIDMYYEDLATVYKVFYCAKKISISNKAYYNYFYSNLGSIVNTFSRKHISDLLLAIDLTKQFLEDKNILKKYQNNLYERVVNVIIGFLSTVSEVKNSQQERLVVFSMLWEQLSNYNLFNLPEYYKFTLVRQTLYFLRDLKFYLISKSFKNVSLSVEYLKKVFDSIISPLSELQCLLDYLDTNPKLNSLYVYGGGESFLKIEPYLKIRNIKVVGIIDKGFKDSKYFMKYKVITLEEVINLKYNVDILIASISFAKEITESILIKDQRNKINIINYFREI